MSHEQQRNLELVDKWAELYNNEGSRFVYECYAEDVVVDCPGELLIKSREVFVAIEEGICAAAPKRWLRIDRKIADGNVVVVQGTWFMPDMGDDFQTRVCSVLTFNEDGLIVNDTTYMNTAPPKDVNLPLSADGWREETTNRFAAWKKALSSAP
jgi:ketosteroid isomerase-like protein